MILNFLQHMLDEGGRAASTIKGYASAISAFHPNIDGATVFSHPLMVNFIKGVERLRPVRKPLAPPWDLPLVLDALCGAPFEPLEAASIKWLSIKTALLLALASGKRVSDLCSFSVQQGCCILSGDGFKAVLRPNPTFTPKVVKSAYSAQPLTLLAFHPPPHLSQEDERLHKLCPVRAI